MNTPCLTHLLAGMVICSQGLVLCAADGIWTNAAGGFWSAGSGWQEGVAIVSNGVARFRAEEGSVVVSNDLTSLSLTGLAFNDGVNNRAAWTLTGNALTLIAPATIAVQASTSTLALAINSVTNLVKTGSGALRFSGGNRSSAGTTVSAGAVLIGDTSELGNGAIRLAGGDLSFMAGGQPGLLESASPNNSITLSTMGTNLGVRLTTRMANTNVNLVATYPTNTQYIYTGRWYVPADASYSFMKNFDDGGYLAIDRVALINDNTWSNVVVVRSIKLDKGWHDLEIRVAQGTGGVGPVQSRFASGIMYDPTDGDFSATNMANVKIFEDPGDGSVLRTDRTATLPQRVVLAAPSGIDLSAQGANFAPLWAGGIMTDPVAGAPALTVSGGSGELRVGSLGAHAPYAGDALASGGVTFSEKVLLLALPVSSTWRIASGAEIAIGTPALLGSGSLTLTNYSVRVLSSDALGASGGTFFVQGRGNGVVFDASRIIDGAWVNDAAYVLAATNTVTLEGAESVVTFAGSGITRLFGAINGVGAVTKTGSGTAELRHACGFTGDVTVAAGRLTVFAPTVGASSNRVVLTGGTFGFDATVPAPTVAWLTAAGGTLDVPAGQTLNVGTLNGTLTVSGNGQIVVASIAANARVTWAGNGTLTIQAVGAGASLNVTGAGTLALPQLAANTKISLAGYGCTLALASGTVLDALEIAENASARISGAASLDRLYGSGVLTKVGEETLAIANPNGFEGQMIVAAGHLAFDPALSAPVGAPGVWFDVSVTNSYTHETQNNNTPDALDVIGKWYDRRLNGFTASIEAYNTAGNRDRPYVMTNALNGKPVISCGGYYISPLSGSWRRVVFSSVNTYFVSMVFGSQDTGGHLLGLRNNWDFQRGVNTNNGIVTSANVPIWKTVGYPVWTNGIAINGQTTGLNGGYQVLSIAITNSTGHGVDTLGMVNNWQNSGGQRYGEILLYTNVLSDVERRANEGYLAVKWGLGSFSAPAVTISNGATLDVRGAYAFAALRGSGSVVKTGTGVLSFGGSFEGSLSIQGGSIAVPNLPVPPAADAIATNSLLLWLDACATGRMTFAPNPGQIFQWIDRRPSVNRFAWSYHDASYPERPWLRTGIAPRGGERFWIDISTNPVYESSAPSKYMKLTLDRDPATYVQDTYVSALGGIRTGFIVLDSSRGGGLPIGGNNNSVNSSFTRDNPHLSASPIWGSGTAAVVTNGITRLDGLCVDGRSAGFSGGVQVLSFTATGDALFWFLGATRSRYEKLGELLFFSTVLAPTNRSAIEAYLLNKWTDKTAPGYRVPGERLAQTVTVGAGTLLDLSAASGREFGRVTGAGSVRAATFAVLPAIEGSIGALDVQSGDLAFTATAQAGSFVVQPPLTVSGTLSIPSNGVVRVTFTGRARAMRLPLASYGAMSGSGFNAWTLEASGDVPHGAILRLVKTSTSLALDILANGTTILVH